MMRKKFTGLVKGKMAMFSGIAVLAIATAIGGVNLLSTDNTKEKNINLVDLNELPDDGSDTADTKEQSKVDTIAGDNIKADNFSEEEFGMDNVMDATDEYTAKEGTLEKEQVNPTDTAKDDTAKQETGAEDSAKQETVTDDSAKQQTVSQSNTKAAATQVAKFTEDSKMAWPVTGNVLINYSMDSTVYFATLNQYKYNSALIIQSEVNTKVGAAAPGTVKEIYTDEETGITMKVDMGNGFTAIYGQLKETLVNKGDTVTKGEAIGYVSEPTKYYSVEGSNLYFAVMKEDAPVNPMNYLE